MFDLKKNYFFTTRLRTKMYDRPSHNSYDITAYVKILFKFTLDQRSNPLRFLNNAFKMLKSNSKKDKTRKFGRLLVKDCYEGNYYRQCYMFHMIRNINFPFI